MKRLYIRPNAPREQFARLAHLDPLVVQVLFWRGLKEPAEIDAFMARQAGDDDPFKLCGMARAVERIRQAIETGERIIVHGDFDADGVTSTALLVEALHALGAKVYPYIPDRIDEGYGLNVTTVEKMAATGGGLLVTVDCGIRANREIEHAARLGIDVIVTDHHSVPPLLPAAVAVVNPKQPDDTYGFKGLSGVGLAYKLAQALVEANRRSTAGRPRRDLVLEELLDLVALGTVADMVPLTGENRSLVAAGLPHLNLARRMGIRRLIEVARVAPGGINTETIGFMLGPRINAAGRLDRAMLAYQLLRAQDEEQAADLAHQLEEINAKRQRLTQEAVDDAAARLADPAAPLLMVYDGRYHEGIVGLVAGRLCEQYYRPTLVIRQGPPDGESRGSARSIPGFDITAALDECADLLVKHGGHAAAAGFTVETRNLAALQERLTALAEERLRGVELSAKLTADAEINLDKVEEARIAALDGLAPFGEENPEPLFGVRNVEVRGVKRVGKRQEHLNVTLIDRRRRVWRGIAWRQADRMAELQSTRFIDALVHLRREVWQGNMRLGLVMADFRPARSN